MEAGIAGAASSRQLTFLTPSPLGGHAGGKPETPGGGNISAISPLVGGNESIHRSESIQSARDNVVMRMWTHTQLLESSALLCSLLQKMGQCLSLLSRFRCGDIDNAVAQLPERHRETAYVYTLQGQAHVERVNYPAAKRCFSLSLSLSPYRQTSLAVYSTVLWHLKMDTELSYLIQQMSQVNRMCPEFYCALGNFFALQKNHASALKYFQRAIKVDPTFTYAYTLCGHECASNDDLTEALGFYESAIQLNSRHYNAWYGIGMVYYRREKYQLAAQHFQRAASINNSSSVLQFYLGMVAFKSGQYEEAMQYFEKAIKLHPGNTLAKFKLASCLVSLGEHDKASELLHELREKVPKEAVVYYYLGKVAKARGDKEKALHYCQVAMDLDSKRNQPGRPAFANTATSDDNAMLDAFDEDDGDEDDSDIINHATML